MGVKVRKSRRQDKPPAGRAAGKKVLRIYTDSGPHTVKTGGPPGGKRTHGADKTTLNKYRTHHVGEFVNYPEIL
jgi:hypothetical protein